MSNALQDFYKATISQDWSIGTGNFYVSVKPTTAPGRLVISPSSDTLREIVEYSTTGTDANGDYIIITTRGVGSTTEQTHTVGEKVRMNITAEDWDDMRDDIDSIVAAGAVNASTTERGIVEIATDAEVIAGTDTGGSGAKLVATPSQIKANYEKIVPIVRTYLTAVSPATWTKPAGLKYIEVEMVGGGGGSAGQRGDSKGGGGAGGYCRKLISASSLGSSETVTVGAGGIAGTKYSPQTDGGNGGTSSFGSHCSANGGYGSKISDGLGGLGGTSTGGDVNVIGGDGQSPNPNNFPMGGASFYGGGGRGSQGSAPQSGRAYGSGAGGASYLSESVDGASGAPGIVIVKEYY